MSIQECASVFSLLLALRGPLAFALLFGGMLVGSAHSDSVTGKNSHNGVALFGRSRVAFATATGVMRDSIAEGPSLAHPDLGPAGQVVSMDVVMPDPPITPGDEARIDLLNRFEFGAPIGSVPNDTWTIRVEGTASAVNAQLGGEPADAFVSALARAQFFIDPITAPSGAEIGQIVFDAVRPLTAKETDLGATISLLLRENGATMLTLGPGSPSLGFPLVVGRSYELVASYNLHVPHGMDPPFLLELGATIIPEPSTLALAIFALVGGASFARQRFFNISQIATE